MPQPTGFRATTLVAALSFHDYKASQERLVKTPAGDVEPRLQLQIENFNQFDDNAMRLVFDDEPHGMKWIGYIPMKISQEVRAAFNLYDFCDISILDHDRGKSYKDRLTISIHCYNAGAGDVDAE